MWWVILSVCIAIIVILIALLYKIIKRYFEMCEVFDELDFLEGKDNAFPQKDIQCKYENVLLLYNIQRGTTEYTVIVDTSKYEKNNLIGLTYLVPAADYDRLAKDVVHNVKRKIKEEYKDEDIDFLEDSIKDTMNGTIIPMCDVYQLKNGRWIWRSRLEDLKE